MTGTEDRAGRPTAILLCDAATPLGAAITRTVSDAGFATSAVATRWSELLESSACHPDVAIVDLALSGWAGTRLLGALHAIAPGCRIIVLAPLDVMAPEPSSQIAAKVLDPSDLRPLASILEETADDIDQAG